MPLEIWILACKQKDMHYLTIDQLQAYSKLAESKISN